MLSQSTMKAKTVNILKKACISAASSCKHSLTRWYTMQCVKLCFSQWSTMQCVQFCFTRCYAMQCVQFCFSQWNTMQCVQFCFSQWYTMQCVQFCWQLFPVHWSQLSTQCGKKRYFSIHTMKPKIWKDNTQLANLKWKKKNFII